MIIHITLFLLSNLPINKNGMEICACIPQVSSPCIDVRGFIGVVR